LVVFFGVLVKDSYDLGMVGIVERVFVWIFVVVFVWIVGLLEDVGRYVFEEICDGFVGLVWYVLDMVDIEYVYCCAHDLVMMFEEVVVVIDVVFVFFFVCFDLWFVWVE